MAPPTWLHYLSEVLRWERRGELSLRILATGIFLFVLVTVAWAQDGKGAPVTADDWLRALAVALATAITSYGAMHVRVQHLERDVDKKADKASTDLAINALKESLLTIRTDMREELRLLRVDLMAVVREVAEGRGHQQP